MPFTDADPLLQPISADNPTGENLEYDPAFAELERAVTGRPEQQIGAAVVPGEEPNWNEVEKLASALLARSKDLRAACCLARALVQRQGFEGLADGLLLLRVLLDRYWEGVHPRLDPDDGLDPTIRANALSVLSEPAVLNVLRVAPLVRSRTFGPIGLREIALAAGEGEPAGGSKIDANTVDAAFRDCELAVLEATLAAIRNTRQHILAIDQTFDERAGGRGPDFARLVEVLRLADVAVAAQVKKRKASEAGVAEPEGADEDGGGTSLAPSPSRPLGELGSRDDVVRALDKIDAYYSRYEPSSPIPLLLQRCKRLVTMSFLDIMRELAPEGLAQVENVVGKRDS
jgi:type VI secretion system protein ImpA